mmetsp:Transcript_84621/g.132173  ORF Transcript_84621/g.132173 Transcript_84621/m.132173 type:complete len:232 (+) Transcript_84621:326-1021(+)
MNLLAHSRAQSTPGECCRLSDWLCCQSATKPAILTSAWRMVSSAASSSSVIGETFCRVPLSSLAKVLSSSLRTSTLLLSAASFAKHRCAITTAPSHLLLASDNCDAAAWHSDWIVAYIREDEAASEPVASDSAPLAIDASAARRSRFSLLTSDSTASSSWTSAAWISLNADAHSRAKLCSSTSTRRVPSVAATKSLTNDSARPRETPTLVCSCSKASRSITTRNCSVLALR